MPPGRADRTGRRRASLAWCLHWAQDAVAGFGGRRGARIYAGDVALVVEEIVSRCQRALQEHTPALAVRDVLDELVADPGALEAALGPVELGGITPLHNDAELTVLRVAWTPGMALNPHEHRMWAVIGMYGGQEDNAFYRRTPGGLEPAGGRELPGGEVLRAGRRRDPLRRRIRAASTRSRCTSTAATSSRCRAGSGSSTRTRRCPATSSAPAGSSRRPTHVGALRGLELDDDLVVRLGAGVHRGLDAALGDERDHAGDDVRPRRSRGRGSA